MQKMTNEATLETLKKSNYPGFRYHYLHCILDGLLQSRLLSREEIRKYYYEAMAVYYSVDHSNTNKSEAIIEANLVDKIEYAFLEAINRRELSEIEKNQIRAEHARYFQMWADAENDSKEWLETYKCELMKFPEFNDD